MFKSSLKMVLWAAKMLKIEVLGGLGGTLASLGGSRGPKERFLGAFGLHFGKDASGTLAPDTKTGAHGRPKAPKMETKWSQNCPKIAPKIRSFFLSCFYFV